MPELPEIETIRRQLEPVLPGQGISEVEVLDPRWARLAGGTELEAAAGRRIESVGRRGKYLFLHLEDGLTLALHLRMTGNLRVVSSPSGAKSERPPYLRAVLRLEGGDELLFTDARRFGHAEAVATEDLDEWVAGRLGVEPLSAEFTAEALGRLAAGRRVPLKSFLLRQDLIAGVGNIYADEALHRAGLHPLSPAGSMREEHLRALRDGVVAALETGVRSGGASIDDYRDTRGLEGAMQDEFLVHTREGEACFRCGGDIRRIVIGGRSSYFCPGCQTRLRARRRRRHLSQGLRGGRSERRTGAARAVGPPGDRR